MVRSEDEIRELLEESEEHEKKLGDYIDVDHIKTWERIAILKWVLKEQL